LILETTTLSHDPETDKKLFLQWVKILFEYCNFQYIADPKYLEPLVKVAKILSVYHSQRDPNKLFEIKSLNTILSLDQILDIIRTLERNNEYYQQIMDI
jgi:hypothetical protein